MGGAAAPAELEALVAEERRYLMGTYARQPVELVRGSGSVVIDSEGRELIDMVAGIAVNVLGHCPAPVRAALEAQASTLMHTSNLYYTRPQVEAARLLVESAFPSRVFFCNSGAEAIECAVKVARKWGQRERGGAHTVVCARGAFHGRTLAALSATGQERYLAPFAPPVQGFRHVDAGLEAFADAVDDSCAAVLVEPIQGEGGVVPLGDDLLRGLRRLCDERGVLLILDEVQTGMGRTGRMWAHQWAPITPDVMCVAKGLGGGVPAGAVLAAPRADVLEPGDHGCTFGGSPLATAVVAAVLRTVVERRLPERAEAAGARLAARLLALRDAGLPVEGVRGRGLMLAVVLGADIAPACTRAALRHGVIVNAVGARALRLVPALTISDAEIDEAVRRLAAAIGDAAAAAVASP